MTDTVENKSLTGREPTGQFRAGVSGNPNGRPRGSRNKLGEQFISDLQAEWEKSGATALERMAKNDPSAFVKTVASILPREVDATLNIDVDMLVEARTFAQNFRMARQYIGADEEPPMIELEAEPVDDRT
jgi:hypothetical protein